MTQPDIFLKNLILVKIPKKVKNGTKTFFFLTFKENQVTSSVWKWSKMKVRMAL